MSRVNNEEKDIQRAVELGRNNQLLIPKVKNWCKNIVITDQSAGMIAEIYDLPMNQKISCAHTGNSMGAINFEWIARDFILQNCLNCEYHCEVFHDNFGRTLIKEKEEAEHQESQKKESQEQARTTLKKQIAELVKTEKKSSGITELSILKLIEALEGDNKRSIIEKIYEASKIDPQFFNEVSVDVLCNYFVDEIIGKTAIQCVSEIIRSRKIYPSSAYQKAYEAILNKNNFEEAITVIALFPIDNKTKENATIINAIFNNLWYKRNVGDPYDSRPKYPNSIKFINLLIKIDGTSVEKLFNDRIEINDKVIRINTYYLIQELITINPSFTFTLFSQLIHSLELEDDKYEESADKICCETLCLILRHFTDEGFEIIKSSFNTLSYGAQLEFLNIYCRIIGDQVISIDHSEIVKESVYKLITISLDKSIHKEINEEALEQSYYLSSDHAELFAPHFDLLLGYLTQLVSDLEKFHWQKNELQKPSGSISTFNPLLGRNIWDLDSIRLHIERDIKHAKGIIKNIFDNAPNLFFEKLIETLTALNSKTQGKFKAELISLIYSGCNDPSLLAKTIPFLYNYLFDLDSTDVRYAAMDFLQRLVSKFDQLVTKQLLDVIYVFQGDLDIGIKGKAIEVFEEVLDYLPHEVTKDHIDNVLLALSNTYVYVHKRAIRISGKLNPFLDLKQNRAVLLNLIEWEKTYSNSDDKEFCQIIIGQMLKLCYDDSIRYNWVVDTYVIKYCDSKDYYTDREFIEKLSIIKDRLPEFREKWLWVVLGFFERTDAGSNPMYDKRYELFNQIYNIPYSIVLKNKQIIKQTAIKIIQRDFRDGLNFYSIFSHFELHEEVVELCNYVNEHTEHNKSNEWKLSLNRLLLKNATLELSVQKNKVDENLIKLILQ